MFSGITISRDAEGAGDRDEPQPVTVLIAGSRPLLHARSPPLPPIPFPSTSLHVDRHKIVTALSSSGAELEITHLPEFTRNAVGTAVDERGAAHPSILVPHFRL